jgi:hypothetical protein
VETRKRVCVVSPSRFRLWDNAGATLEETLAAADVELARFDPDVPTSASPLALAETLSTCDAICAANTGRADLPPVAPTALPWVTWVTNGRIPGSPANFPHDRLVLADGSWRSAAHAAGWSPNQISVATWPAMSFSQDPKADSPSDPHLALLCDTLRMNPPGEDMDLSSHVLLWEAITEELRQNPLAAAGDANAYLSSRMKRLDVLDDGFDRSAFLGRLIFPAFQQGLARMLASAGLPLRLYGQGWSEVPDLKPFAAGAITSAGSFRAAIATAAAVVHVWPLPFPHPIDAVPKPVVRPACTREAFLRSAGAALRAPSAAAARAEAQRLSAALLLSVLGASRSCSEP